MTAWGWERGNDRGVRIAAARRVLTTGSSIVLPPAMLSDEFIARLLDEVDEASGEPMESEQP